MQATNLSCYYQVVAILKGHTKKVSCVVYHPNEDTVITASPDTQVQKFISISHRW